MTRTSLFDATGAAARVASHHSPAARAAATLANPEHAATLTVPEWLSLVDAHGRCCAYCGVGLTEYVGPTQITMEHMTPTDRGGDHALTNVVPACSSCNAKKGNLTPLEWFALRAGLLRRTLRTGEGVRRMQVCAA